MRPGRRTDSTEQVVAALAACAAFIDVDTRELHRLADRAAVEEAPPGESLPPEIAGRPLLCQQGTLLVCEPDGRPIDLLGPGGFRVPNRFHRLRPLDRVRVAALPGEVLDLAWGALRQRPVRPRSETEGWAQVWSAACAAVMRRTDGFPPGTPTVEAGAPAIEALLRMLTEGTERVGVLDGEDRLGTISASDLPGRPERSTVALGATLREADSVEAVGEALVGTRETMASVLAAGATATDCGRVLAGVTDRTMRRLLDLAPAELDEPPAPFAWLCFGSQARREQALSSDQDTGLAYAEGLDAEGHRWFAALGDWMTDALDAVGFPRCPGKVMASNPDWRHDLDGWQATIERWADPRTTEHLVGADIGFDLRAVGGNLPAEDHLVDAILAATSNELAHRRLARDAVQRRPPRTMLGRVAVPPAGRHRGTFDMKRRAIQPIVDLARMHTLARGGTELGTVERLAAAAGQHRLSAGIAAGLRDGFELLGRLRLEAQIAGADGAEHNRLAPEALHAAVRAQLRRLFRDIDAAQQRLRSEYHLAGS